MTNDHPVQSFVWDDFTAKPGRKYEYFFHPVKGSPKNLDRSAKPIRIAVETEPLYSDNEHDVFFNRGVASSQAYSREFDNKKPDDIEDPKEQARALQWLSRDLDEALFKFIDSAKKGDTLLGCFYEFRYEPAAERFADAIKRGVDVRLIIDAKVNESTDKDGVFHPSFPREENKKTVKNAKLTKAIELWREGNPSNIAHNKFIVLLKGASKKPKEVWTGSTNLSMGGIHGQTNVGHWVKNEGVAKAYAAYWEVLKGDPGSASGDDSAESREKKAACRKAIGDLAVIPSKWSDFPKGTSTIFSPRAGSEVLEMYVAALDEAADIGCITLAFGINQDFKDKLAHHTPKSAITFMLLEKRDKSNKKSKNQFVALNSKQNVYQAWGSYISTPLYQWTHETNASKLQLNQHVSYVHSKFLLKDPLGADPIVVTGSANFSTASTNDNDENMILIRGDQRAADIYFTEFNRIFNHYYFRSVLEAVGKKETQADKEASLFLREDDGWIEKYKPGSFRRKRVEMFTKLAGAK
jgi:phosphatidylserine/phosphatidylglycerophosphate/cardiolipin synthase-like enzyme